MIYIYDFDSTLTKFDIANTYLTGDSIFRDNVKERFVPFIYECLNNGDQVIILSYNIKSIIIESLLLIMDNVTLNKLIIVTPEMYGLTYEMIDLKPIYMKKIYIDSLIKMHNINANDIFFYDNEKLNIITVAELGVHSILVLSDTDLDCFN